MGRLQLKFGQEKTGIYVNRDFRVLPWKCKIELKIVPCSVINFAQVYN